jgi:dipeptidyl-peptidase-4
MTESFPRQQARTRRFSLGVPRSFKVAPDGRRVAFLRSQGGADPVTCLWQLRVDTGNEELLADPASLEPAGEDLSPQEKARRERTREQAGGIVGFATDRAMNVAAFTLAGRVYVASLPGSPGRREPGVPEPVVPEPSVPEPSVPEPVVPEPRVRELGARSPAIDPRPDPAGTRVAYVCGGALRVIGVDGSGDVALADPAGTPGLSYGLAEFIAAEEMGRIRGYWWAPDGASLLVARVDESPVQRWHIADPANPDRPPAAVSYPSAGTPNAEVSLLLAGLDGRVMAVDTGGAAFPYLVTVSWDSGDPLIVTLSRDQRVMRLLAADPVTGATTVLREDTDPRWLDIVPGTPARTGDSDSDSDSDGRIVWVTDAGGARRLLVGTPEELAQGATAAVTPPTIQVREVLSLDGDTVLFTASAADPTAIGLWQYRAGSLEEITPPGGVHAGTRSGGTTVITSRTLDHPGPEVRVLTDAPAAGGPGLAATGGTGLSAAGGPSPAATEAAQIAVLAETPNVPVPQPDLFAAGPREIRSALLFPSWYQPGTGRLPVLLDPYGGPHAQRVLSAQGAFLTSQWLAEQGFAVLVADGRGTPGRGPEWEREVWHDLAGPVLEDQVEALQAAAVRHPDLDTSRVAIRGWSFGGYLSALAVLRRPDVFHAAVAGAPVTDWRLYDTCYTERYLGHPDDQPEVYAQSSLLADAPRLARPLLFIHGLADDNVVVAHTLRMSSALLAAGRGHIVLPLSGVTHMTPQEEVAENLLLLQVEFLREALGMGGPDGRPDERQDTV